MNTIRSLRSTASPVNIGREERRAIADFMGLRYPTMSHREIVAVAEQMTVPEHAWLDLEMRRARARHTTEYDPFASSYRVT